MRLVALISGLMALGVASARAHDPYEITSVVYVRSNVMEVLCEMEFPTGMRVAGAEPMRDVAVSTQFEKAQPELYALAGSFFELTVANDPVLPLTTNVELGAEGHIRFTLDYPATPHRPLQFSARGLRSVKSAPYGTTLTVLDMVNQKVLGQATLFADSPPADFPASDSNTIPSADLGMSKEVLTDNPTSRADQVLQPRPPKSRWLVSVLILASVVCVLTAWRWSNTRT